MSSVGDVRGLSAREPRAAARAWPLLGLLAATLACGDDDPRYTPEAFSLTAVRVPPLGCSAHVPSLGDCTHRSDCQSGTLCARDRAYEPEDRAPIKLTCGAPIGSGSARDRCEYGNACATGLCALAGVCVDPCHSDLDCEAGMQCRAVEARIGHGLSPVMACTRPLVLPASAQLAVSPRPFELMPGNNEIVVPSSSEPALMLVQGSCEAGLELLTLREGDSRRVLYDQAALRKGQRATNTVLHDGTALAALLFPNNPVITPGALRIGLRVSAFDAAQVVVATRTLAATTLDLNVFYVGGGELWVDGGFRPGDPEIPAMLRRLNARYRAIGLSLGEIREYDVTGARREELSVLEVAKRDVDGREVEGRPQRLDELFALSAGVDDPGINVFIVSDMGGYVGIAGGIPGPIGVHGSERSGVALAIDVLGDLREADLVLMHELSHYMGLFHTTESGGTVLDPLDDTPECRIEHDVDGDHHVSAEECASLGADNLMFWSGAGSHLTRQQVEVLASSVVLR